MKKTNCTKTLLLLFLLSIGNSIQVKAQTVVNGFYPEKGKFTVAASYTNKNNDQFFVGNQLAPANPANLGEINTTVYSLYTEYGITDWLSGVITLPYITVESEAGTPDPVQGTDTVDGIQDLSVFLKAKALELTADSGANFTIGGALSYSLPVGGYNGAGILSIGNQANSFTATGIMQYTTSYGFFTELQGGYSLRNSSDFEIPNAVVFSSKIGYFCDYFYFDTKLGIQNSQSGLNIGTPQFAEAGAAAVLPETDVDYTELSFSLYVPVYKKILGLSTNYATTLEGRNYNDFSGFSVGLVYSTN